MSLFLMIESVIIPVKTGIQIFITLSKRFEFGDQNYVAAQRRKKAFEVLL